MDNYLPPNMFLSQSMLQSNNFKQKFIILEDFSMRKHAQLVEDASNDFK